MGLKLNRFCCCCTLRTGSLVIGTMGWVWVFGQIFYIIETYQNNYISDTEDKDDEDDLEENLNTFDKYSNNIYGQIGVCMGSSLVSGLLLYGVYKANRRFLLPWLVFMGLEDAMLCTISFVFLTFGCLGYRIFFLLFIICGCLTVLYFYFWLCVWSHYQEIGEANRTIPPSVPSAPYDSSGCPPKYIDEMTLNPV